MLIFTSDYIKTKSVCRHSVKKWSFVMYFPSQYKTQEIVGKIILENGGMRRHISDCYKNKKCVIKTK